MRAVPRREDNLRRGEKDVFFCRRLISLNVAADAEKKKRKTETD